MPYVATRKSADSPRGPSTSSTEWWEPCSCRSSGKAVGMVVTGNFHLGQNLRGIVAAWTFLFNLYRLRVHQASSAGSNMDMNGSKDIEQLADQL